MPTLVQAPDDYKTQHRRPLRLRLPSNAALAPNIGCCNALLGAYVRAELPQWQKVRALQPNVSASPSLRNRYQQRGNSPVWRMDADK